VWVPFLGATRGAANLAVRVFPDARVYQYWDEDGLTSDWFAKNVEREPPPAWDVYFLYGPGAVWEMTPAPLLSSGGTVIGESSKLEQAIAPLLAHPSS
jgi:hypothetical protein